MVMLIFLGSLLIGFVLGYFLKTILLIILSVISIGPGIVWLEKKEGMEALVPMIFMACVAIANATMWLTWYVVNDKTFLQELFKHYILR